MNNKIPGILGDCGREALYITDMHGNSILRILVLDRPSVLCHTGRPSASSHFLQRRVLSIQHRELSTPHPSCSSSLVFPSLSWGISWGYFWKWRLSACPKGQCMSKRLCMHTQSMIKDLWLCVHALTTITHRRSWLYTLMYCWLCMFMTCMCVTVMYL